MTDPAGKTVFDDAVVILGGSNSVMREGWSKWFRIYARDRANLRVINRSIGAASSLMAVYRILADDIRGRNVTVVWEYAINEDVCVRHPQDMYSPAIVERNLTRFLILCARRGIRVLPLLLPTQRMWKQGDWRLADVIEGVFMRFGTNPFRYDRLLARRIDQLPGTAIFLDTLHFEPGTISKMIASNVLRRIDHAKVPVVPDREAMNGLDWFATRDFQNGEAVPFKNRLLDIRGHRPAAGKMVHPAPARKADLLGIALVSHLESHGFDMSWENGRLSFASAPLASKIPVQMKIFPVEAVRDTPVRAALGQAFEFCYSQGTDLLAPATFNPHPGTGDTPARPLSTIAGLMWETAAGTSGVPAGTAGQPPPYPSSMSR